MSSLGDVLSLFASSESVHWDTFGHTAAIAWRDAGPVENIDAVDACASHYQSGTLLLLGFGLVELPNGELGLDAGINYDNEGYASISLIGDAECVHRIEVMKFYPSFNYQEIIQWQIGDGTCAAFSSNPQEGLATSQNAVKLVNDAVLYVVAYTDEEGGKYSPGSTTFVFHKDKPIG
jgi:hypothetical protein